MGEKTLSILGLMMFIRAYIHAFYKNMEFLFS